MNATYTPGGTPASSQTSQTSGSSATQSGLNRPGVAGSKEGSQTPRSGTTGGTGANKEHTGQDHTGQSNGTSDQSEQGIIARAGEFADRAGESMRGLDDYVRSHPWQAVTVAGALGVVVGLLVSRR